MYGTEFARISGSYSTAFIGTYEVLSQSTAGNSTTFRLYGYFYYGGGTSVGSSTGNGFYLDGTYIASGNYRYYPGYTLLGTKDITVTHNNDGSFPGRSVGISASSYHMSGSTSGNIYANKIDRQATVTSATDFNDEGNPTIKYSNPGGFRINARLEFAGSIIRRDNIANTGTYTFDLTEEERKLLRQKCTANSMTVREVIATCISGSTESFWSWQDKTMTLINANPEFSNFTFKDINETTIALTGNDQNIIKGASNVEVTIPVANKATAKKEATMKNYRFTCGDKNQKEPDMPYSETKPVIGTIDAVPNGTFKVFATDSRNNSTSATKLANQVIDYSPLTKISIDAYRSGGVSEEVILQLEGTINIVNFGKATNSIKSAEVRYRIAKTEKWSDIQKITLQVVDGKFSYNGVITGDLESKGFNISNSYEVEVVVTDELSSVTFTDTLGSGIPNLALHKNGISVMGKYDVEVGGKFQVGGKCYDHNVMTIFTQDRFGVTVPTDYGVGMIEELTDYISVGNKLNYSNSKIIIGKGVSKIKVSVILSYWKITQRGQGTLCIYKNDVNVANASHNSEGEQYNTDSIIIPPCLIEVKEGDEIALGFQFQYALTFTAIAGSKGVNLTVEVVE